jgi:uncharacterized protein (TIGR02217 family)
MSFIESPRFPDAIAYDATGGPAYSTDVVELNSGFEQRNANWAEGRCEWDVSQVLKHTADMKILLAFFRTCKGRAYGFRFKDFLDYQVTHSDGRLGSTLTSYGLGEGIPSYGMGKLYVNGSAIEARKIKKPVSGTVEVKRGGAPVTFGSAPGNIAIDTTTGSITFVADATSNAVAGGTVGATTTLVLAANPGGLTAGKLIYLTGFGGVDAALVNNKAHTINSVSGSGPYTFILATNTAGKDIALGSGVGAKYPQASDTLTWSGEFDVPARFSEDTMKLQVPTYERYTWEAVRIIEIRV